MCFVVGLIDFCSIDLDLAFYILKFLNIEEKENLELHSSVKSTIIKHTKISFSQLTSILNQDSQCNVISVVLIYFLYFNLCFQAQTVPPMTILPRQHIYKELQ